MSDNKKVKNKIFESSSLSALFFYLSFIFGILNTFLIVRLISPEEWVIILFALSFLNFAVFLASFIPLSAEASLNFYIPQLLIEKEKNEDELLSFIYYNYRNRLFFSVIIYILFFIIIYMSNFDTQTFQVIMILSPLILLNTFQNLNIAILMAFQKFKRVFLINMVNTFIKIIGYIIIYYFQLENPLFLLTSLNLFQGISSFSIAIFSIITLINIKRIKDQKLNYKDYKKNFQELNKTYAINLTISNLISYISGLLVNILYVNSRVSIFIAYLTICESAIGFVVNTSSSKQSYSVFSQLYKKSKSEFKFYLINYLKYSSLANAVVVGIMFFFVEIYVELIYIEVYFVIIPVIQVYLLLSFSRLILRALSIISNSSSNTKILLQLNIFQVSFSIINVIIAITTSNFELLILLYIISSYLSTIISFMLVNHYTKLNLKMIDIYKTFLLFLAGFIIAILFSNFINIHIFGDLIFLDNILNSSLRFLLYLFIFYILIYLTRYITREEYDKVMEVIPILNSKNKYIQKIVKTIKLAFPSEQKE